VASFSKVRAPAIPHPISHTVAKLSTAEDNMNVQLKDITVTARDGRVSHLEQVYIRGSHVRYFIVPDMLRYDTRRPDSAQSTNCEQERTHVPVERHARPRCRSCTWSSYGEQGEGEHTGSRSRLSWDRHSPRQMEYAHGSHEHAAYGKF
jgi:hypothetical protein